MVVILADEIKMESESLPSAILYKNTVLDYLNKCNKAMERYYLTIGMPHENSLCRSDWQSRLNSLFTYLRPKLKKKLSKKDFNVFATLEQVMDVEPVVKKRRTDEEKIKNLKIAYMRQCLNLINVGIEKIGITKIEIDRLPPGKAVLDE